MNLWKISNLFLKKKLLATKNFFALLFKVKAITRRRQPSSNCLLTDNVVDKETLNERIFLNHYSHCHFPRLIANIYGKKTNGFNQDDDEKKKVF